MNGKSTFSIYSAYVSVTSLNVINSSGAVLTDGSNNTLIQMSTDFINRNISMRFITLSVPHLNSSVVRIHGCFGGCSFLSDLSLFTIPLGDSNIGAVSCRYFNTTIKQWIAVGVSTIGIVTSGSTVSLLCGAVHFSDFSSSISPFLPDMNMPNLGDNLPRLRKMNKSEYSYIIGMACVIVIFAVVIVVKGFLVDKSKTMLESQRLFLLDGCLCNDGRMKLDGLYSSMDPCRSFFNELFCKHRYCLLSLFV
jgi:hypothetical protein